MISMCFYYFFFASAVILYGVGLNSATIICDSIHDLMLPLVKIFTSIIFSVLLSWLIASKLMIPLGLAELYPLMALIIFIIIAIFIETLIRITTGKNTAEFSLSFLIVLLALNESLSVIETIIISVCSFASYLVLIPVLYSIKKRIAQVGNMQVHGNQKSLVLISIAVIVTILAVGNVSWLNSKVVP